MRLGINSWFFAQAFNINADVNANSLSGTGDVPVHLDKVKPDFLNGNLLIDIFPWRSVGIHVTAGLYVGKMDIPANGSAPEAFDVGGYIIRPGIDGNFKATLKMGNLFKPYFGLGFGHTIPKSIVGFKFDLGVIYQGAPKLVSDNMDINNIINDSFQEYLTKQGIPKILTEIYPIISLSLIFRIK
jgi:hypothetical protein